jgi:hypothetical protein
MHMLRLLRHHAHHHAFNKAHTHTHNARNAHTTHIHNTAQERRIAELESQVAESAAALEAAQSNRSVTQEALDQV